MKTLRPTRAWILICSLIVVSNATKHPSSHLNGQSHHGDNPHWTKLQNTTFSYGIQIPENVLSASDVACISADNNIFKIMDKAQNSCKGNDLRCTFYHFIDHEYQKIGTTEVNKQLFDDLLMKFDNWLLTAENIEKGNDNKSLQTEETPLDTADVNDKFNNDDHLTANDSETENKIDHNDNEIDNDKIHTHHSKKPHKHHSTDNHVHGDQWKNENQIVKDADYNKEHRYFEVFLPKDKETGKQQTIYVEVDEDKNEFALVDEEIDKKLHNDKPIKIELDLLSEIADTAFNDVVKSTKHIQHSTDNLSDNERASDVSTTCAVHEDEGNLDLDAGETTQSTLIPTVLIPKNDITENDKIEKVCKNFVVPDKYINQAQFIKESQLVSPTDDMPNHHLKLLESTNHQTDFYEESSLDDLECNSNNSNIKYDLDKVENESEDVELPIEHENVTNDNDSIIQLAENNDICNDSDINDTHNFLSSDRHQNEPILEIAKHYKDSNLKSTPITSDLTRRISDYTGSQLDVLPSQNLPTNSLSLVPNLPLSPFTSVPIIGKDLAKAIETDPHLQSSFPVYATLDTSHTPSNSDSEHSAITFPSSSHDLDFSDSSPSSNVYQYTSPVLPYPPLECVVRLKGSEYSPFNVGFSWLPSYSRIEELRLPSITNSLSSNSCASPQAPNSPISSSEVACSEAPDHTVLLEDQDPSFGVDVQEKSLPTRPLYLDTDRIMVPKPTISIPVTSQSSDTPMLVSPCSPKNALSSPGPNQQVPQSAITFPTEDNFEFIKQPSFDTSSNKLLPNFEKKETNIPYSPYGNKFSCPTIPYSANPFLTSPYLGRLLPKTPLRPVFKMPSLNSLPLSLDQTCSCKHGDPQEPKAMSPPSFAPNTPFSPLNPLLLGSGFFPNTWPCPNPSSNAPHQILPSPPYTGLLEEDIRMNPPAVDDNSSPESSLENGALKPFPDKSASLPFIEHPCSANNILEMTPPTINTLPGQMDYSSSALERDLEGLSLKYGIPLSKILKNLATKSSDANTCQTPVEKQFYLTDQHLPTKNAFDDENGSENEELVSESDLSKLTPLDSSLTGSDLDDKTRKMLDSYNSQSNTVSSQTTVFLSSPHPSFDKQDSRLDSSLIIPHLSSSTGNEMIQSESDSSYIEPLDSSLIGPHLDMGSLLGRDTHYKTVQPEVPLTSTTQLKSQLKNLKNEPSIPLLESKIRDTHMPLPSVVKPYSELQSINEKLPESDFTNLTPIDTPRGGNANEFNQPEIVQYKKPPTILSPGIVSPNLTDNFDSNLVGSLSDSSGLVPLDSTLIGPHLNTGTPLIINDAEHKLVSVHPLNTDGQIEELESIILPPSLLPSLLDTPVKADLNPNIHTQDTKSNAQLDQPSFNSNVKLNSYKENDFNILERNPELSSIIQHKIMPSILDSATELESSLGVPNLYKPIDSSNMAFLDSKSRPDTSLSPSLLREMESLETPHAVGDLTTMISLEDKMKKEKLQPECFMPLDFTSLTGPSFISGSGLEQSVTSRYHDPELLSVTNPEISETTDFVYSDLGQNESPLTPTIEPTVCTNPIYKPQRPPYGIRPSDNLIPIHKSFPSNPGLPTSYLNTPLSSQDVVVNAHPIAECKVIPIPETLPQSYAEIVPHIPISSSPCFQMKPLVHHNWQAPQLIDIRNFLQASSGLRPGSDVTPFNFNAVVPLTPGSKPNSYPYSFTSEINTPEAPILPAIESDSFSNDLPSDKYVPSKTIAVCDSVNNPISVDDIISLLDEYSCDLLKHSSDLLFEQSSLPSTIPIIGTGTIVPPSSLNADLTKTCPVLSVPFTNPMVPSSIYNPQIDLFHPQNINMIQTPNMPHNLQPFPNVAQFSEIIGPAPKIESLPLESVKKYLESPFYEMPNTPQLTGLVSNPILDNVFIQQPLSDLPCSSPDTKIPIAPNELNSAPYQLLPISFTPESTLNRAPHLNAFMSPILPTYTTPSSVLFAKPKSVPTSSLQSNIPYTDRPPALGVLAPASPHVSDFTTPFMPVKTTRPDYTYPLKAVQNRPTTLAAPYKPSASYSSPYLPVHSKPFVAKISPCFTNIMSALKPTIPSLYSPEYGQPISTPICKTVPKSLTNLGYSSPWTSVSTSPMTSMPTSILSPYVSTVPFNTRPRPSNILSPAYFNSISPVSSSLSPNNRPLPPIPIFNPNLQLATQESQLLRPLNTLPTVPAVSPFPKLHQNPYLISPKTIPIHGSDTKPYIPCDDTINSNLETTPYIEEVTSSDNPEEIIYAYSNDRGDKFYEQQYSKNPLQSLSLTLASEEVAEPLSKDLIHFVPINGLTTDPSMPSKSYQGLYRTPCIPFYSKPVLRPCLSPQLFPAPCLINPIQQNTFDNIPCFMPMKTPVAHPESIFYSPSTSAYNLPSPPPLLPNPCTDTPVSQHNTLPMKEKPTITPPFDSATETSSLPIDPRRLRNTVSPQVISDFSQIPMNSPYVTVSSPIGKPATELPSVPYILDSNIQIQPTFSEFKPITGSTPNSLRPSLAPFYGQYVTPITSRAPPSEVPITSSSKSIKPNIFPQYISSVLPTQTPLKENYPLYEASTHYQPRIPISTAFASSPKKFCKPSPVTTPYPQSLSFNNIVQSAIGINNPQWSSNKHQYLVPVPSPTPVSVPTVPLPNIAFSKPPPHSAKPLTYHITPSTSFIIPGKDFQKPVNNLPLSPLKNIPKNILPSLAIAEPLGKVPGYMPSRTEKMGPTPIILKPTSDTPNVKHTVPLSSLPCLTQPLQPAASYPSHPDPLAPPYTTPPQSKLSPVPSQYAGSSTSYTTSQLQKLPNLQISEPILPPYLLPNAPIHSASIHAPCPARNPFINSGLKPVLGVPSHPVSNLISTPLESVILSSILRPLDNSKGSYASPITSTIPCIKHPSSSTLMPLTFSTESRQNQPQINSNPQLLLSTKLLLESPVLKPLLSSAEKNASLLPMHGSTLKPAIPEKYIPSVSINDKYFSPPDSLVSELPDTLELTSPSSNKPYSLLNSPLNKQYQSPVPTLAHMPVYSNYDILESPPKVTNTAKPIEISSMSSLDLSQPSPKYLEANMKEEIVSYDIKPDLMDRLSPLSISYSQQNPCHPAIDPRYLLTPPPSSATTLLQNKIHPTLQYTTETGPLNAPSFLPADEADLVDNTNYNQTSAEPLTSSHFPTVIKDPLITNASPRWTQVIQSSPYTMSNIRPPSPPRPKSSPVYINPQEYEDLTQCLSSSSSSPIVLTSPNTGPQMINRPSPVSLKPTNWLQSPTFTKSLSPSDIPMEVTTVEENLPIISNKYTSSKKITPLEVNSHYEPEFSTAEIPVKLDSVNQIAPLNPLFEFKPSAEYNEVLNLNENIDHDPGNEYTFNKTLPEIKGFVFPYNNKMIERLQRFSKVDHFYENNHIGSKSQVLPVSATDTSPAASQTEVPSLYTAKFPEIVKYFTDTPTKQFVSVPKLNTINLTPVEYNPGVLDSPAENPAITITHPKNYLNPYLESDPQFKYSPTAEELSETPPISYPYNNIEDIKYSGYKTYQLPSLKSPQITKNLGLPAETHSAVSQPFCVPTVPSTNIQQIPGPPNFDNPTEIFEPQIPEYQKPIQRTTPHQTKLDHNTLQETPELNEYNTIVDIPIGVNNINEDNELKTSLINYINKKEGIKDNLDVNDKEITIPLGNIAIVKKEPSNADIIQTNNPSIGLKVWKSNIKLAQAELKLKFKDISAKNFMPIVNNVDEYDVQEIRKIVKNYIDEKYGSHIEVNEPYTIDNKYTIIKDFDHNASGNKYNLLWPTNYV